MTTEQAQRVKEIRERLQDIAFLLALVEDMDAHLHVERSSVARKARRRNMKDKTPCSGCRDNFYNSHNPLGVSECWLLKSAKLVRRWRLHWWTTPVTPGAFVEVKTYNCHNEPGGYAFYKELPLNAVEPERLPKKKKKGESHVGLERTYAG